MNTNIDNLKSFIEKIRCINFFQRLFGWSIRDALIELSGIGIKKPPINDEGSVNVYTTE